ncbi:MAG: hypothetical protein AAF871_13700 [Pseudomonadota bacterium]
MFRPGRDYGVAFFGVAPFAGLGDFGAAALAVGDGFVAALDGAATFATGFFATGFAAGLGATLAAG